MKQLLWRSICWVAISVAAVSLLGAGACCWMLRDRVTDVTESIREDLTQTYVLTRPMFIAYYDNEEHLDTGVHIDNYPHSMEEYRAEPRAWPIPLRDELPAGTAFRILECIHTQPFAGGEVYLLQVKIVSGRYKGRTFPMSATEILEEGKNHEFRFLPFVKPAPP